MKRRMLVFSVAALSIAANIVPLCLLASGGKKQQQAEALFARARAISNLQSRGSPPFVLKAQVTIYGDAGGHEEGDYYVAWESPEQSRAEVSFPAYRSLTVTHGTKVWHTSNLPYLPYRFSQVTEVFSFPSRLKIPPKGKVAKIREREISGLSAECVVLSGSGRASRSFCFDPATGHLIQEGIRKWSMTEYADYAAFGTKAFPRTLSVLQGGVLILKAEVVDLSFNPRISGDMFTPLTGVEPHPVCNGNRVVRPHPVKDPAPHFPLAAQQRGITGTVILYTDVGTDGIPRGVAVVRSPDLGLSQAALQAVRRWRFTPGTCGGTPVETTIYVEATFRFRP